MGHLRGGLCRGNVAFGASACLVAFWRHRTVGPDTTEFFLTARKSVGTFRIAWSFYAAAMGSWTLFSPAQYSYTSGGECYTSACASS